jgi:hypothetical protein
VVRESRGELGRGHLRTAIGSLERAIGPAYRRGAARSSAPTPALTPNKHVELLPGRPLIGSNPDNGRWPSVATAQPASRRHHGRAW